MVDKKNTNELGLCPFSFSRDGSDYGCNPNCEWFDKRRRSCCVHSMKAAIERLAKAIECKYRTAEQNKKEKRERERKRGVPGDHRDLF